jgi:colicin import membrane protein
MPAGTREIGKAPVTAPIESQPIVATTRVTVLLILDVKTTGIRRFGPKTADPVICSAAKCWVSAGPGRDATLMARGKALGPGNTLGKRAAACNHKLACVFRSVELGAEWAALQPIDLRIMRHDRRPELSVRADRSCDFDGFRLSCATLYRAADWRAWIVPEPIAIKAGPEALETALESGLPPARAADAGWALEQR